MSLNHLRKGSVTVPQSFIEESSKKYTKALQRVEEPLNMNEDLISSVVKRLRTNSFEELIGESVSFLSANASTEKHHLGQFGVIYNEAPKVSLKMVLDQTYNGMAPMPYFGYSLVNGPMAGRVSFLPEPLKVRSITTSSAWEFAAGKPFQSLVSSSMKHCPNLLYGRMVQADDISCLVKRSLNYWTSLGYDRSDMVFISGDYDAATDNINPSTSCLIDNLCFRNRLLPDFDVPLNYSRPELLGLWGAMGIILEYLPIDGPNSTKKNWININLWFQGVINQRGGIFSSVSSLRSQQWSGREVILPNKTSFIQSYGQMMGDIKSFPVLCLLNLCLWEDVCENKSSMVNYGNGVIKKEPAPCLVNGDDFLTYCPRKIGDIWRSRTGAYNFTLSVGKTYESERLAVINSQPFYVRTRDSIAVKIEIPYLNLCMKQDRNLPLVGNLDLVIDLRNTSLKRRIYSKFLSMNREAIANETRGGLLNLFIHRDLGGLGAKPQADIKVKFTRSQRLVAYDCERRWKSGLRPTFTALYEKRLKFRQRRGQIQIRRNLKNESFKEGGVMSMENGYKTSGKTRLIARDDWISRAGKPVTCGSYYFVPKHKSQIFRFVSKKRQAIFPDMEKNLSEFVRPNSNVKDRVLNHGQIIDLVELARVEERFSGIEPPNIFL